MNIAYGTKQSNVGKQNVDYITNKTYEVVVCTWSIPRIWFLLSFHSLYQAG
mgnify:CR=1 FL=1